MLFSALELQQLHTPLLYRVRAAIENGDYKQAKALAARFSLSNETVPLHDFQRNKITALLTWIGRRYGNGALYEAQYVSAQPWIFDSVRSGPQAIEINREFMANFAAVIAVRGHELLEAFEDEEKFIFTMVDGGGRMIRDGYYDPNGRYEFFVIEGAQPMTFSEDRLDVYNAHVAIGNILYFAQTGAVYGCFDTSPPWDQDGVSVSMKYKDPTRIPAEHYEKVGIDVPRMLPEVRKPARLEFTAEELQEMTRPMEARVKEAIEAGDGAGARDLLDRVADRWSRMRRIYGIWPSEILEWMREHQSKEDARAAWRDALERCVPPLIEDLEKYTPKEIIEQLARYWHANLSQFTVEEDAHQIRFTLQSSSYVTISRPEVVAFAKEKQDVLAGARSLLELIL